MKTKILILLIVASVVVLGLLSACASGRLKSPEDWNKTERGAAIGGAGGAAVGAITGSATGNAGAGALIGGAAGAAAGGLIGNELDKDKRNDG